MVLYIICNGTLLTQKYADENVRHHVVTYAAAIGDSFLLMHNITWPHSPLYIQNMHVTETIQRMELVSIWIKITNAFVI